MARQPAIARGSAAFRAIVLCFAVVDRQTWRYRLTTLINAFVIFAGMFWLLGAISDEQYRHYWGWGLATILFGVVMPLGSYQTAGIFAGCWLLLGSLSTAAIMAWHLRKEPAHDGD